MHPQKILLLLLTLLLAILCYTCTPHPISQLYVPPPDIPIAYEGPNNAPRLRGPCDLTENYIPDSNYLDHYFLKELYVNIHWMNSSDSSQNLNGKAAIDFAKGLIRAANYDIERNRKMFLPHGNNTPVLPVGYKYVLKGRPDDPNDDGIYFHYDDKLYYYIHKGRNANLGDRNQIKKYGVRYDSVMNIFLMPHHPDSVASKTYGAYGVGVALGSCIKMAGPWTSEPKDGYWNYRGSFNHEVGHILGLAHAWRRDGCDDTPEHNQECRGRKQRPGCDTLTSNNVMDYAAKQHAWSPCQIGRMQYRIANMRNRARYKFKPNWCSRNPEKDIVIRDSVVWKCHKDLEGNLRIENGGQLTVLCRLSIPAGASITVAPEGKLILEGTRLHNACNLEWDGIFIEKAGNKEGEVVWNQASLENAPIAERDP